LKISFLNKLRGGFSFLLIVLNTVLWMGPLFVAGLLKFAIPIPAIRRFFNHAVTFICKTWNTWNKANFNLTQNIRWHVTGDDNLDPKGSYLVLSNHQSWVDILVLQGVFLNKIPFLKFFIKQELVWIPVLGFAWWALDFPFMKRYSKEFLGKNPHLKGKDLETTRQVCEKFKTMPVSVMNFVEGTRFTPAKHQRQDSPFKNLLRPKAGGTALVLDAMGSHLQTILDVTIVYPHGVRTIWEFLCNGVDEVVVKIKKIPITSDLIGDYFNDPEFQKRFQIWLNRLWEEKDALISDIAAAYK
jgi:1-acyl-sn-glycerol-3-phosphate acyltransferase